MLPELSVHADLEIATDEALIRVSGDGGQTLKVRFPSLRALLRFWRRHGEILRPILDRVPGLMGNALTFHIVVGEREIARMGADARPNWLSRIILAAPVQVNPRNIARALLG